MPVFRMAAQAIGLHRVMRYGELASTIAAFTGDEQLLLPVRLRMTCRTIPDCCIEVGRFLMFQGLVTAEAPGRLFRYVLFMHLLFVFCRLHEFGGRIVMAFDAGILLHIDLPLTSSK